MTALLALDTHPFLPGPGAEWGEPFWAPAAEAMTCHARPVGETDQELGELLALAAETDQLLILYPLARQARVEALLRVLRQVNSTPIAGVATRMPPLSAAVLALLLRRLGGRPGWDAGHLAAVVPLLERQVTAVSWVRRIGRPVRAAAVAGSRPFGPGWLSVNGFEIRMDGQHPEGLRIAPHRGVPVSMPEGNLAFAVGRRGDEGRLAPVAVWAGEPGGSARSWYATSRSAELVFLDAALATLTEDVERALAAQVRLRDCEWCGSPTPSVATSYAFCANVPAIGA